MIAAVLAAVPAEADPAVITAFTPDKTSPQRTETGVTFTAAAWGGVAPLEYKYHYRDTSGPGWIEARGWSTSPSWTWSGYLGTFEIKVFVRSAGHEDVDATQTLTFTWEAWPAVTIHSFTPDKASPQRTETGVTFTAAASGGVAPLEYKYHYRNTSGPGWIEARGWSTNPSWTWSGYLGTFEIKVFVRSAGHEGVDATQTMMFTWEAWPTVTINSFTPDKASPQRTETSVTFTAAASGGVAPLEYKYHYRNTSGPGWIEARGWSTSPSWTWSGYLGTFEIKVFVRSAGHEGVDATQTMMFTWEAWPTVTINSFTPDKASPQRTETGVTFTAAASGGVAPLEYKYHYRDTSGPGWIEARGWSTNPSWTWSGYLGTFEIKVFVRSAGHEGVDATQTMMFTWEAWPAVTITSFTPDKPSPQRTETSVTFTAAASGGEAPLEYKYHYRDTSGPGWIEARGWTTNPSWTWSGYLGTFEIKVFVRSAGHEGVDATQTMMFTWEAWPTVTINSFTPDKASPQRTETSVTFTAAASGGVAPLEYKYHYRDTSGPGWIEARGWSTNPSWTWSGYLGTFEIKVFVRSAGHEGVDATETMMFTWETCGVSTPSAPPLPGSDIVWIDDAVAAGMSDVPWSSTQQASGTQSIHVENATGAHGISSTGATTPYVVETGTRLALYVLLNPCTPPREIQIGWHSATTGWHSAWWGEALTGNEGSMHAAGTLPTLGEWVRLEVNASDLGLEGDAIGGFRVDLFDGEAWADHLAFVPSSSCTTPIASTISRPWTDDVWIDDSVPAGMSPVEWSAEQVATGYASIVIPNGLGTHGVQTTGATQPILTETGSAFAFYLLLDPCAMPREVQVRWQDDVAGWKGAWWGEELIGSESQLAAQGTLPPGGQWIRVEIPLSDIDLENASVGGFEVRLFDGRAWVDSIAYLEPGCAMTSAAAPAIPAEVPWVDDSVAAGMPAVLWSTRQKASGSRSMHLPNDSYIHQIEAANATTPLVVEPEGGLAFYLLLNECALPEEVQFEWLDAEEGWKGIYWGEEWIGNEYSLLRRGTQIPTAGEWVRVEVPASFVGLVNRPITGFRLTLFGGEAWLDRVALVEPPPTTIVSMSITPAEGTVVELERTSFVATALLRNGTTTDVTEQVIWYSSDNLVAGISAGVVTGLAPGSASLLARSNNNVSATASVTVTAAPPPVPELVQLEVTPVSYSLEAGETVQLAANATYSDATIVDETVATGWSTDDATIATVDANGVLHAVAEGFATITGTFEGFTAESRVAVTAVGEECRSLYVKDETRLWMFDGSASHPILEDAAGVRLPRLSPDGHHVVYKRQPPPEGGPAPIVIANADSGLEEHVIAAGTLSINAVLDVGWRTNGRVYLIGHVNPSTSLYYEIDAITGAIDSQAASARFSVSHDGAYLLQDEFVPRGAPAPIDTSVALLNGVRVYPPSTDTEYHRFALNYAWSQDDTHFAIVDTKPDDDEVAITIIRASDQVVVSRTLVPDGEMPRELTWQASGLLVFRAANVSYRLTTAGVLSTLVRTPIELQEASISDEDGEFAVVDRRCITVGPSQLRHVATNASRDSGGASALVLSGGVRRLFLRASSITSTAGSPVTITVSLAAPAPAGGATVVLTPTTPVDGLPETLQIPEGQRSAQFSFRAPAAETVRLVTINARSHGLRGSIVVRIIPQSGSLERRKR